MTLGNAVPGAAAAFVLGLRRAYLPLAGGTLVPNPDLLVPASVDPQGGAVLTLSLPPVIPVGL